MAKAAKKGKGTGRFGSRYGKRIRDDALKIERMKKNKYVCPKCSRASIVWKAVGVWQCKKCNAKFASAAYTFKVK